jgi:hypothetical protein
LPALLKLKQYMIKIVTKYQCEKLGFTYRLAEVLPRLSSRRGSALAQSNIRTIVPFWLAVASLLPS